MTEPGSDPGSGDGGLGSRLERIVTAITLWTRILAGLVIVAMMATTVYDVVMRYAFARPTEWALTLNAAGILAATFLAVPHLAAINGHIDMDLFYRRLGRRGKAVADSINALTTFAFGALLAWLGYRATYGAYASGLFTAGNFALPMWSLYAMVYLGGLGLAAVVLMSPWRPKADPLDPTTRLDTSAGVS